MWINRRLRLFGALFAIALVAAACGSDATTTEAADAAQTDGDAMSDMQDDEMDDHDDDHSDDGKDENDADHSDGGEDDDAEHDHGATTIDVDAGKPIPEVAITLDDTDTNVTISATLEAGTVSLEGDDRVKVGLDDVVMIMITADVDEEVHLHGYDISTNVTPGDSAMILFTADTAGRFEIEFEKSGAFIAELEVS